MLRIATWNLNHRVGKTRFKPEAANATSTLPCDLVILTEYYPRAAHDDFVGTLGAGGFTYHLISREPSEVANRVLIASRVPIEKVDLSLPTFDEQFPANVLAVRVGELTIIGIRVPWYEKEKLPRVQLAWDWLLSVAAEFLDTPTLIAGDLNAAQASGQSRGGVHFRELLSSGWTRIQPAGAGSCYGKSAVTEIDHILGSRMVTLDDAKYVLRNGDYQLAGAPGALSDHAAVIARVEVKSIGPTMSTASNLTNMQVTRSTA